jgi:soluble lytic murein transglycosylase-like protein
VIIVAILIVGLIVYYNYWYKRQKIKFLYPMLGKRAELFLEYVDKYNNNWLEELARIRTESDFNRRAKGKKGEVGWYQIMPKNYLNMHGMVENIILNPNDEFEINLVMGNLHYAACKRYDSNWLEATEIYNIGLGSKRAGKKNSDYVMRYLESYEFLLAEWNEFMK